VVIGWRDVIGETATRKLMGENAIRYLRLLSSPWDGAIEGSGAARAAAGD
jgi:hypothetical protein